MFKLLHGARAPILLASICAAFSAQSQTSLEPVVVTASRGEQKLADALPATTVITEEQIRASGALDLAGLLAREAGIQITQLGGIGTLTSASLRGGESRMTLVLVDGVPINTLNFSQATLQQILPVGIERIEIVRGNVSALYGAQAVGGVVQIFTKSGREGFDASASALAGSRGMREATAQLSGGANGITYAANLGSIKTNGFSALDPAKLPDANPDKDGFDSVTAGVALGVAINPSHSVKLSHRHSRGDVQYDSEFGPPTQSDESHQSLTTTTLASRNRFGPWQSHLQLSSVRDALDARITAFPFFAISSATQLGWQNDVDVAQGQVVSVNAEHTRQRISSDTVYDRDLRSNTSLAMGYRGDISAHGWQLNLRRDRYSDFGNATTYYAGYGIKFAQHWRVSAAASSAFNAPTFNDLFFPGFSNPNLKPESTRSKELALQWAMVGQRARLAAFENRYEDLIGFDENFNIVNINRAKNRGVELMAETKFAGLDLRASATSQKPRNAITGKPLLRRAEQFGALTVGYASSAWTASSTLRLTGSRPDRGNRTLAGYTALDAALSYAVTPNISALLRAQNVTDRSWQDAYGYNNTPRTLLLGVEGRI
jgi:vitamin B12 transporter